MESYFENGKSTGIARKIEFENKLIVDQIGRRFNGFGHGFNT